MKNNKLRAPLINSAILLAVVSLVVYLTVSSPEGSIWSSIGAIFYTLFKAAQLAVGLLLALVVCLAVLVGIFFGCVAMVSRESSAKMYDQLRGFAANQYSSVRSLIAPGNRRQSRDFAAGSSPARANDVSGAVKKSLEDLRLAQRNIEEKLRVLQDRIEQGEQNETITKLSDWLRAEEKKTDEVSAAMENMESRVQQLSGKIEDITGRLTEGSSADAMNDLAQRLAALEKQGGDHSSAISKVKEQIDLLGREREAGSADAVPEEGDSGEHRLFSYIENEQEKEKIQQLVIEAMDQEMTYAQATDYLVENVSPDTAKIIAEHPALTRELLREHRKQD